MKIPDAMSGDGSCTEQATPTRRRSFLVRLLALPVPAALLSRWWLTSSQTVVVRDGWVLSKDD